MQGLRCWLRAALLSLPFRASVASTADVRERDPCDDHMDQELGWLKQYITVGFFTDYQAQVRLFYSKNETSYAFLWLNSITFANLDFAKEACPEAAQLALLIRSEERLPMREAEPSLLDFASMAATTSSSWPLASGLERLKGLTTQMMTTEEYSVDIVIPYCNEPLEELLSRSTGYGDLWLSSRVPLQHVKLVLYRLLSCVDSDAVDMTAAGYQLPSDAASVVKYFRSVEVVLVDASPKAWEAARYLLHLVRCYETLADFTIFLHPDVFEHVNPRTLRNVLQSIRVGTFTHSGPSGDDWFNYISLSHHYLTRPSRAQTPSSNCTDAAFAFKDLWSTVFAHEDSSVDPLSEEEKNGNFGFYCCSQFLVHRERVRKRPRSWYQRVAEAVPWEHCATSYMELLWHAIFNDGRLHERKRQDRTDLPLFLRIDNFLESTSEGLI